MSRRTEIYVFMALLLVLGFVLYRTHRGAGADASGVYADSKFRPLDVQEPELHLDLLENIRKTEQYDSRRNIFVAEPVSAPRPKIQPTKVPDEAGPRQPLPPPPLQVPVQYFGYASEPHSGRRLGFFTSGDDVLVLAQGDTFLNRFRLLNLTNNSADVVEISSGRRATLPITQPPGQAAN